MIRTDLSASEQSAVFHEAADQANDALIHDTLHAAGALVGSVAYVDLFDVDYIVRWLDELWRLFVPAFVDGDKVLDEITDFLSEEEP